MYSNEVINPMGIFQNNTKFVVVLSLRVAQHNRLLYVLVERLQDYRDFQQRVRPSTPHLGSSCSACRYNPSERKAGLDVANSVSCHKHCFWLRKRRNATSV